MNHEEGYEQVNDCSCYRERGRVCQEKRMYSQGRAVVFQSFRLTLNRFPVPQDNFVPVATSSNCLVGC